MELDPESKTFSLFADFEEGTTADKWRSGVLATNGKIYGIPYGSENVLEIDPDLHITHTFGNFGLDGDKYQNTENPAKTGCFEVKKIYDLAGNVWEWTLEAHSTNGRVYRRRFLL